LKLTFALFALAAAVEGNLQSALDHYQSMQQIPGVAAVVTQGDRIVFAGASGVADLETGVDMSPDTVFYIGSVSKVFTAVLTLLLIEDDALSLDDVAVEVSGEAVRVRHLLLHTSGLGREGDFEYWYNARFPDAESLREYLAGTRLRFAPGKSYSYSNIAYAALGPVVEHASGMSFENALTHHIASKLGMARTGTGRPAEHLATGYSPVDRVLPNENRPFAGLGRKVGDRYVREYHGSKAMTPAFGISASARDLSFFTRALLGFGSDFSFPERVLEHLFSDQGNGRGYAMRRDIYKGRVVARHGGWFAAHRSYLLLDLDSGISVTILANSDSASPGTIAEGLLDAALQSVSSP
tara:strand:- start:26586 stop:27644 length:1059 start_codon:yes stop_codon:yes gene_type:complete